MQKVIAVGMLPEFLFDAVLPFPAGKDLCLNNRPPFLPGSVFQEIHLPQKVRPDLVQMGHRAVEPLLKNGLPFRGKRADLPYGQGGSRFDGCGDQSVSLDLIQDRVETALAESPEGL